MQLLCPERDLFLHVRNQKLISFVFSRGPSLADYKAKGYGDALKYQLAQGDSDFLDNVADTSIVLGTGVGGGTLHFGMQYIDQPEISDASSRQPVTGSNIQEEVDTFGTFSGATTYSDVDYGLADDLSGKSHLNDNDVAANFEALYDKIDEVLDGVGKSYRNKVYKTGTDIEDQPRLLVGGET